MCRENFSSHDEGLLLRAKAGNGGSKPSHLLKGHAEFAQSGQYRDWQLFSSQKSAFSLLELPGFIA